MNEELIKKNDFPNKEVEEYEYKGFLFNCKPETEFKEYQVYEHPGDTKSVKCAKCGRIELEVGQGSYFTVVRCPNCKHEACIHDG